MDVGEKSRMDETNKQTSGNKTRETTGNEKRAIGRYPYPRLYIGACVDEFIHMIAIKYPMLSNRIKTIGLTVSNEDAENVEKEKQDKTERKSRIESLEASFAEEDDDKSEPVDALIELRDIIDQYNQIDFDLQYPLILNVSYVKKELWDSVQAMLLKFLEETHHRVILLSTRDTFMATILSRCPYIKKTPPKVSIGYGNPQEAREEIRNEYDGEKISQDVYMMEKLRHSYHMCKTDIMCRHFGGGMKDRLAYILEHK